MINIDLSGKSILITGALGAIAEPMVRKLAAAGATLVLLDIRPEAAAKQILRDWKIPAAPHVYFSTDITDSAALNQVVNESFKRFPTLDTVLGHAGGCGLHPFATTSEADYDRIFRFNYFAQVNLARAVFAHWMERKIPGHLIFTSSYVARMPHTQIPSYASAKAALENFARCMALEYAPTGIRVNVVSPGNVAAGSSLKVFDEDPAYREFVLRVSLGRRNSPESIADAFVFLCSPLANEINGQILSPDYGAGIGNRL
ncbi:MAG TPA: SDR family oxidoreductase [Terriglobales bacterium]|jgi:NAD(P)-dependent dehydrogenase (short-subunit alcohol dehydrogenase family)|nr:SDR family oxidoreductase [Terriglobales bacterium]